MVQVRQLENEQKVKLEIQLLGGVVFIQGDLQVTKLDRVECQLVDPRFLES
ncbi:hypothetical protein F511_17619 [Dorcoceras hygrometricum]|uniref:Uncharacterized protein n=1 Tax=Dorcoceras hygrometricum TaxID=472368 RepID=A0A2Z7CHR1_9LAMI|nr:hypothetical protein F511_17619 [Dorcoceras hygrometricum]